jgi:Fic family protein
MSEKQPLYTQPSAMEPLLPAAAREKLQELTCDIWRQAGRLSAQIPSSITRQRIVHLVREMNSYYSNLIEGHKTLPRDIERALRADYSAVPDKRANQHLSRAHIEVEGLMTDRLRTEPSLSTHSEEFICWLHQEFYARLPEELHFSTSRAGKRYRVASGQLRDFEVQVGRHQPPHFAALPQFLQRFGQFYGQHNMLPTERLIAVAAAHHRLAWIHPFGDGNGRVARLCSHAALIRCQADGLGLWTISRGLARQRRQYYELLSQADQKRWNDHDGRGNLSDKALGEFCVFFLQTMQDQIEFMTGLLQLEHLTTRIERHLQLEALHLESRTAERLARLLKAALIEGEIERGRVREIIGLGDTAARVVIRTALKEGLMDSATPKGPLAIVFDSRTLESYFPQLYQDLPLG